MSLLDTFIAILSTQKKAGDRAEDGRPHGASQDMLNMNVKPLESKADAPLFSATHVTEARRAKAWIADRVEKSKQGIFSEEVALTPVLAELLLESNPANRSIREGRVLEFATDIANGDWELNGEAIIIADTGELNDGQHRCRAVIMAGKAIQTLITFGVRRASRLTVDVGSARTAGDFLGMDGHKNANVAAAACSLLWQFERFDYIRNAGAFRPTKAQVRHTFEQHPEIAASIDAIPRTGSMVGRSWSLLAFCHYVLSRKNKTAADYFIMRLTLGDGLTRGDPIYHAREKLLSDSRLKVGERVEIILRTWNASRQNRKFTKCAPVVGTYPQLAR